MKPNFQHLIAASVVALVLALGGILWLVWQSFDESHELERQNRELRASLEASRIRVENFCEYPTDALCKVDEKAGSVSSAMNSLVEVKKTPVMAVAPLADAMMPEPPSPSAKNVADVMVSAEPVAKPEPEAKPEPKEEARGASPAAPAEKKESKIAPAAKTAASSESREKTFEHDVQVELKESPKASVPALAPVPEKSEAALPAEKISIVEPPVPAKPEPEEVKSTVAAVETPEKVDADDAKTENVSQPPLIEAKEVRQHEVFGRIAPLSEEARQPVKDARDTAKAAPAAKDLDAPKISSLQKSNSDMRKSWSRVEHDGDIFVFTITGSGSSLPAHAALRHSPWSYELTLDGLWEIKKHNGVENRLVKRMSSRVMNGKTVVVFHLKQKPYRCSMHRQDARTVSVRIR